VGGHIPFNARATDVSIDPATSRKSSSLSDEIVEWNERSIADAIRRQARHEDTTRWDTIDFKLD